MAEQENKTVLDGYTRPKSVVDDRGNSQYLPEYVEWLEEQLIEIEASLNQARGVTGSLAADTKWLIGERLKAREETENLKYELQTTKAKLDKLNKEVPSYRRSRGYSHDDLDFVPQHGHDDRD
jgi:capsule polysaccharide export protein KpsE/RkpR